MLQAALARAEKTNGELSESLADEKADRVLYLMKSQVWPFCQFTKTCQTADLCVMPREVLPLSNLDSIVTGGFD